METNREMQKELVAPSGNQCPMWEDVNALNHWANADSLC